MQHSPKRKSVQRYLFISDLHCGHRNAIAPPKYNRSLAGGSQRNQLLARFRAALSQAGDVDCCFLGGDLIDGRGERSGSVELLSADRQEQVDMALSILGYVDAPRFEMCYGTPYHTGAEENWEDLIALELDCKAVDSYDDGTVNMRHHCGGSSTPYGGVGQLQKEAVMARIAGSTATLFLRGHVHKYQLVQVPEYTAVTNGCFQGASRFGSRKCLGKTDTGVTLIEQAAEGWKVTFLQGE